MGEIYTVNPALKSFSVLNRGDSQGKDNDGASEILKDAEGLSHFPFAIRQRKAFSNAAAEGLSVVELKPQDKKATAEIKMLCSALFKK